MDIRAFKTPQDCSLKNVYLPRHASEVCSCNMCKLALVVHEDLRNSSSCEGKADGLSNHQVSMWAFLQCRFCVAICASRIRLRSPRRPGKFAWRLRLRIGPRPHVERVPHSPRLQQLVPHPGCLFSLVVLPVDEGIGELRVMPTCPPVPLPITPRS